MFSTTTFRNPLQAVIPPKFSWSFFLKHYCKCQYYPRGVNLINYDHMCATIYSTNTRNQSTTYTNLHFLKQTNHPNTSVSHWVVANTALLFAHHLSKVATLYRSIVVQNHLKSKGGQSCWYYMNKALPCPTLVYSSWKDTELINHSYPNPRNKW